MIPDLPERLVAGRQVIYFRYFFDVGTHDNSVITDADVEHYANAYGDPDHLRSAFEVYRALPANMTFNAERTTTIDVPLLLVGGERVFGPVMPGARREPSSPSRLDRRARRGSRERQALPCRGAT
jgi:hypothetical protein